jgi:hypothetical protein
VKAASCDAIRRLHDLSLLEFGIAEETDVRILMPQAKSTVDMLTRK